MDAEKFIMGLSLNQLVMIAIVLAALILAWQYRDQIKANFASNAA